LRKRKILRPGIQVLVRRKVEGLRAREVIGLAIELKAQPFQTQIRI